MADKRPARQVAHSGDREVIDYHFKIEINVVSHFDEKRLRKLIDDELVRLKAAVVSKKP
ncbi:MAG: hypothetical protein ACTHU0_37655 [Kofleriaceae bacterium]